MQLQSSLHYYTYYYITSCLKSILIWYRIIDELVIYFDSSINLDIPNNIVPICPNCHSQIHLGSRQARLKIISELYVRNKAKLLSINPNLTLSILASYYNIGLENEEEKNLIKKTEKTIEEKMNSLK